jgi:putative ABC transport system permease protein
MRDWCRNKIRTALSILGIALGVAIAFAMTIANQSAIEQFSDQVNALSGGADVTLRTQHQPMWDIRPMLSSLNTLWEKGYTWKALTEVEVRLWDVSDTSNKSVKTPQMLTWLGVDMLSGSTQDGIASDGSSSQNSQQGLWQRLQYYRLHPEAGFESPPLAHPKDMQLSLFTPGTVWVSDTLAHQYGWQRGSTFYVIHESRQRPLRVGAIYRQEALGGATLGHHYIIGDIGANAQYRQPWTDNTSPQAYLEALSSVSKVLIWSPQVETKKAYSPQEVCTMLDAHLPQGVLCESPQVQTQQTNAMLASYRGNLKALSLISLLVSMLLIYNTYAVGMLRRRDMLGMLKGMNVPWHALTTVLVIESLSIGLIGSLIGVGLGRLLAQVSLQGVSQTMQLLYTGQAVTQLHVSWLDMIGFVALGMGATLFATLLPIQEAKQVPAAQMVRTESLEPKLKRYARPLAVSGSILGLLAYGLCLLPPWLWEGVPVWGFLAAKSINFCGILWLPWVLVTVLPWLQSLGSKGLGALGSINPLRNRIPLTPWRVAIALLTGHLSRSWMATSSLLVTVGLLVSLSIMIFSFQQSVQAWIQQSLRADIWIQATTREVSKQDEGLIPDAILSSFRHLSGVEALDDFYDTAITIQGRTARLGAGRSELIQKYGHLKMLEGKTHVEVLETLKTEPNTALVSEAFAHKFKVRTGTLLPLPTPSGSIPLKVIGVYADYASDLGYIIVDKKTYIKAFRRNPTNSVALYVNPQQDTQALKQKLLKVLPKEASLIVQTNRELKAEILRIFNRTFAITYALQGITLGITLLTLVGALLMMTLLSQPTFRTLTILGMSKQSLKQVLVYQSLLLGGFGMTSGACVGGILAIILVEVINKQAFGWSIGYAIPWQVFLQWAGYGVLTLLGAAWLTYALSFAKPSFLKDVQ